MGAAEDNVADRSAGEDVADLPRNLGVDGVFIKFSGIDKLGQKRAPLADDLNGRVKRVDKPLIASGRDGKLGGEQSDI